MAIYSAKNSKLSVGNTQVSQPLTPTIGLAYDNGASTGAFVEFTAADALATSFTATSTPGSFTATGAASPLQVTGLSIGSTYTFRVFATNTIGQSLPSAASNPVTIPASTLFGLVSVGAGTSLQKWDFDADTFSTPASVLTYSGNSRNSHTNPGVAGYAQMITTNTSTTAGTKVLFPSLTASALGAPAIARIYCAQGSGNTGVAGYSHGGYLTGFTAQFTANRVAYPSDTQSTVGTGASGLTMNTGMTGVNVGSKACIWRDINNAVKTLIFTFSTEVYAASGDTPYGMEPGNGSTISNQGSAAYMSDGNNSSTPRSLKWNFSNDSKSQMANSLFPDRSYASGIYKTGVAGYACSGNVNNAQSPYPTGSTGAVNKLPFSTETFSAVLSTVLAASQQGWAASNCG